MADISRRSFLTTAALATVAGALAPRALCAESAPLIGVQLYSAREALAKDFPGTLKRIAAIGYREVEAAGFFGHTAPEVKQMMTDAGLRCVSAHYSLADLLKSTDATIEYAKTLGLEYVICSWPGALIPAHLENRAMTLDDWKWNAGQFNKMGRKMRAAGLKFGYHNHTMEFQKEDGGTGFNALLKNTDPHYVTFELDCGWAVAAGQDPAKLMRSHPTRISMVHLKDLKPAPAGTEPDQRHSTIIGEGVVDFRQLFSAAKAIGIKHYFVEQEEFDGPVFPALRLDFTNASVLARGGSVRQNRV